MRRTLDRLHRDERGMSFVFVGLGFMSFLAATTLAIDVGMFMTARSQAQTSADAAALSGAIALAFDDYSNRSASGPAVQSALAAGRSNQVIARQVEHRPGGRDLPAVAERRQQPRAHDGVPHQRAWQRCEHDHGPLLRYRRGPT